MWHTSTTATYPANGPECSGFSIADENGNGLACTAATAITTRERENQNHTQQLAHACSMSGRRVRAALLLSADGPTRYFRTSRDLISSVSGEREAALRCLLVACDGHIGGEKSSTTAHISEEARRRPRTDKARTQTSNFCEVLSIAEESDSTSCICNGEAAKRVKHGARQCRSE